MTDSARAASNGPANPAGAAPSSASPPTSSRRAGRVGTCAAVFSRRAQAPTRPRVRRHRRVLPPQRLVLWHPYACLTDWDGDHLTWGLDVHARSAYCSPTPPVIGMMEWCCPVPARSGACRCSPCPLAVVNVARGGTLHQHLPEALGTERISHRRWRRDQRGRRRRGIGASRNWSVPGSSLSTATTTRASIGSARGWW